MATTPYTSQALMESSIGADRVASSCCEPPGSGGAADPTVVANIIARVSGLIDEAATRAGYATPLDASLVTEQLQEHATWMACHRAARRMTPWRDEQGRAFYAVENTAAEKWVDALGKRVPTLNVPQVELGPLLPLSDPPRDRCGRG